MGNIFESEEIFNNLLAKSRNDTITSYSKQILKELLWYQNKWTDYYNLLRAKDETPSKAKKRLLFASYIDKSDEVINFTKDVDTMRINIKKGLIFVPVEINGKTHEFLFDTGARYCPL